MTKRTGYAYYRFLRYLLHEFRWPLGIFLTLLFGIGLLLKFTYPERNLGYAESCYGVFMMIFMQPTLDFPSHEWYLQILFFLVPLAGLGAVADSVVRLGFLVFSSKQKLPEWQQLQASLMRNHIVVVGCGRVGYRILRDLLLQKIDVVAIERKTDTPLVRELLELGVTILFGEGRLKSTLEQAGVAEARAVILATDDDLANLDSALTAREIKPDVRVVLRLFDETLATKVAGAFKLPAISTAAYSASAFIAAATGRGVYQSFSLDGTALHVTDVTVTAGSALAKSDVGRTQTEFDVNIVMHKRDGAVQVNPPHDLALRGDDKILVIAPLEKITALEHQNR